MFNDKIDLWLSKYQQYFFKYKNGFFWLSMLSNSPMVIIESFRKMPFIKKTRDKNQFIVNNVFIQGIMSYQEIENDLWIFVADVTYKKNVCYRLIYDKTLLKDYYFLSLNCIINETKSQVINDKVKLEKVNWTFFKPGMSSIIANFKDANVLNISIYFTENWLSKNLLNDKNFIESGLSQFIQSNLDYILWNSRKTNFNQEFKNAKEILDNSDIHGNINLLKLKLQIFGLISEFIQLYKIDKLNENYVRISDEEKFKIQQIEKYLLENLTKPFVGIDDLCKKFNSSPTKLKINFKQITGTPIYQYFQQNQMQLAKHLIENEHLQIKEVANILGYESPSKFSAAFQKKTGNLPSKIQNRR